MKLPAISLPSLSFAASSVQVLASDAVLSSVMSFFPLTVR